RPDHNSKHQGHLGIGALAQGGAGTVVAFQHTARPRVGRFPRPPEGERFQEASHMEFRWVAFIALWTFLSGPVFGSAPRPQPRSERPAAAPIPTQAANQLPRR